jgi:hypothetical protein
MKSFSNIFRTLLVLIIIGLIGCTTLPNMPPTPPQAEQRDRLTIEELMSQSISGGCAVHNAYFMPVGNWKPALHDLRPIYGNTVCSGRPYATFRDFPFNFLHTKVTWFLLSAILFIRWTIIPAVVGI